MKTRFLIVGLLVLLGGTILAQTVEITYEQRECLDQDVFGVLTQSRGLETALKIRDDMEKLRVVYTLHLKPDSAVYTMRHRYHTHGGDTAISRGTFRVIAMTKDTQYLAYKLDTSGTYFVNPITKQQWIIHPDSVQQMLGQRVVLAENKQLELKAWFAPGLPAICGPQAWKGLPGAILQTKSTRQGGTSIQAVEIARSSASLRQHWPRLKHSVEYKDAGAYAMKHFDQLAF